MEAQSFKEKKDGQLDNDLFELDLTVQEPKEETGVRLSAVSSFTDRVKPTPLANELINVAIRENISSQESSAKKRVREMTSLLKHQEYTGLR